MTRVSLFLAALVAFAAAPSAQTFGVSVSGLSSDLDFETPTISGEIGSEPFWGAGASAVAEWMLRPGVAGGVEVGYTQGGYALEFEQGPIPPDSGDLPSNVSLRVHQLTLGPVVTAARSGRGVRPYLSASPRVHIRLAETSRLDGLEPGPSMRRNPYDAAFLGVVVPVRTRQARVGVQVSRA